MLGVLYLLPGLAVPSTLFPTLSLWVVVVGGPFLWDLPHHWSFLDLWLGDWAREGTQSFCLQLPV